MTFDGIVMAAVAAELARSLQNARVDGVYQPGKLDVVIVVRRSGQNVPVIVSAEASTARVHVSFVHRENPAAPPAFCMLLRKHLTGARIARVVQRGLDRVLEIGFSGPHDDDPPRTLVIEVMGRHSNIILVDAASGMVLDSIKHIGPALSRVRTVRPGVPYAAPPSQGKLDPLSVSEDEFREALERFAPDHEASGISCVEFLNRKFQGLGRDTSMVIASRAGLAGGDQPCAGLDRDAVGRLWTEFCEAMERVREARFSPCAGVHRETGEVVWVSVTGPPPLPVEPGEVDVRQFPTAAEVLDFAYTPRERAVSLAAASAEISRVVARTIDRLRRKLAVQEEEMAEAGHADDLRRVGELIAANAPAIRRGSARAWVVDYFDPELRKVEVDLDPRLSPRENAQHYFRRYSRAKRRLAAAREQASGTRSELEYLEQVATTIEQAESAEALDEIRRELVDQGYLARPRRERAPGPKERAPSGPLSFTVDGHEVLVGRNNTENDLLTLRMARPDDMWLHARGVPGAHVIIRAQAKGAGEVSAEVLLRAAEIAAHYSKARGASKVAVDHTLRRHVRKARGARPGMVIYDHERTIMAAPRPPDAATPAP